MSTRPRGFVLTYCETGLKTFYNFNVNMGRKSQQAKLKKKAKAMKASQEVQAKSEGKYSVDQLLQKTEEYLDMFNYELAEKFCERALDMCPHHVRALETLGTIKLEIGNMDAAKQCFSKAIEVQPDRGHSKYMYMGQLLTGMDAIRSFRKGIQLLEAELADRSGAGGEQLPAGGEQLPAGGEQLPTGRLNVTDKHNHQGQSTSQEGASSVESGVSIRDLSSAYCSVAEIYLTDTCFVEDAESQCKACLDLAVAADSINPEPHHLKASYHLSLADTKSAWQSMETGLSLWLPQLRDTEKPDGAAAVDPINVCPVSYPTRVNVAKTLIELEKYDLATEVLELLLDEEDTVVEVWYLLGWAHFLQGDDYKSTARYYLEKAQKVAAQSQCEDEQLISHVGELLQQIGPGDGKEEDGEEENGGDMDFDLDTDSEEEENAQTDAQTDTQTNTQTELMEH